jgi:hypothetical protein
MALSQVKSILLKIGTDPDYRQLFVSKRELALEKYRANLTTEEFESLLKMSGDEKMLAEQVAEPVAKITFVGDIRS